MMCPRYLLDAFDATNVIVSRLVVLNTVACLAVMPVTAMITLMMMLWFNFKYLFAGSVCFSFGYLLSCT